MADPKEPQITPDPYVDEIDHEPGEPVPPPPPDPEDSPDWPDGLIKPEDQSGG